MHIKIVKCSKPEYWYRDRVGEVFAVQQNADMSCKVISGEREFSRIFPGDWMEWVKEEE